MTHGESGSRRLERRFSRRRLLQYGTGISAALLLPRCDLSTPQDCPIDPDGPPRTPPSVWLSGARVAGLELFAGQSSCEIRPLLDALADQHVSVVEIDSDLSAYLNDQAFEAQLNLLDTVARGCHLRGMRAVVYYPILEVLTADAGSTPHTMYKDHPDWIQTSMGGDPNTFIGSKGSGIFWVDEGTESAWMCPTSGYRAYFLGRVAALARTGLDGLWGDVPLLSDLEGVWPCVNATCQAKFLKDTGLKIPDEDPRSSSVWTAPAWRRWAEWRHQLVSELEQEICKTAKSVRQDFEVIIETVTMDYCSATCQGLDGAFADDGPVHRVWEVDAASDATAMRGAAADDWISMAVMMRHARGCSSPRPSWVFCYGSEADDAERVMALAIAAGHGPYETKIPLMNTSVGADYRRRMFAWIESQLGIYQAQSANLVAVLYSPASRDFLDAAVRSSGLYTSFNPADKDWWSQNPADDATKLAYVGDYRGCCKALIHAHVPYDVVTAAHLAGTALSRYKLLVAPSPVALGDPAMVWLKDFVSGGGTLLLTGTDAGAYDELGTKRSSARLLDLLGLSATATGWTHKPVDKGRVVHAATRAGLAYYGSNDATVLAEVVAAAADSGPQVITNAPPAVLLDLRRSGGELLLLCANLDGLGSGGIGTYTPRDSTFDVSLAVEGQTAKRVTLSEPTAGAKDRDIAFDLKQGRVSFNVTARALLLATVAL